MKQQALFPALEAPEPARRAFGLAWYNGTTEGGRGAGFRPFQEWRRIMKGPDAGKIEITFCSGKKRRIRPERIRIWPDHKPYDLEV
jgi:hypothetical protein